jgi:hypothetical protein
MFNQAFFQTMENITRRGDDRQRDAASVSRIFTPNVRFVEVVEDGSPAAT